MNLFGTTREKRDEVMGINRRNLEYVYRFNPRRQFLLADDKVRAKELLAGAGLPVPETIFVVRYRTQIPECFEILRKMPAFAIKPARSFGGQGLLVLRRGALGGWENFRGESVSEEQIAYHMASILSGLFAISGDRDDVLVEALIVDCPEFRELHGTRGVSDIRVIVCESEPVMAMLRLPTKESNGAANLHAGGLGVGIDIETGKTTFAIQRRMPIEKHPDSGIPLGGRLVPHWKEVLNSSRAINRLFGMNYLGVDFVIDERRGPLILEVNVRPGLDIQLANQRGLLPALKGHAPEREEGRP
ncbi:MAG: sugar-transfer associated ATP-grasp domain-containing protein [Bdellovibrionota bacterium]